jgi:hypothetical protein
VVLLIERGIRQYLQQRGGQLDYFHSQLRQAVKKRYLQLGEANQRAHIAIAAYFRQKADPLGEGDWSGRNTGDGLAVRCPRCNATYPSAEEQFGTAMLCPHCTGPLKVNPFAVKKRGGLPAG